VIIQTFHLYVLYCLFDFGFIFDNKSQLHIKKGLVYNIILFMGHLVNVGCDCLLVFLTRFQFNTNSKDDDS